MTQDGAWWSKRWLEPITSQRDLRMRLRKGRVAARRGRVEELTVRPGLVTATVNRETGDSGSVKMRMSPISDDEWDRVIERLSSEASHAALLLAGRISEETVELMEEEGAELFPFDLNDLSYFCTCEDERASLCVHQVAVHYALADAIEADPFVLLEFRGRSRDQLMDALHRARPGVMQEGAEPSAERRADDEHEGTEPAEALASGYWEGERIPRLAFHLDGAGAENEDALPVVRALGPGPAETPPEVIAHALAPIVRLAARRHVANIVEQVNEEEAAAMSEDTETDSTEETESLDDVLVAAAHEHGSLTSSYVAQALGVSVQEARRYLQWLVEEGRLQVKGRTRGTRYVPPEQASA